MLEYLYRLIQLYTKIFTLKEELLLKGKVDWYVLNNERSSLFSWFSFEATINNWVEFEKHNAKLKYSMSYKDKYKHGTT